VNLKNVIEAILFVSGKPVKLKNLVKKLNGFTVENIKEAICELVTDYNGSDRAIEITEVSGGWQMRTRVDYKEWIKNFVREKDAGLTRSVLESLAIVAYRQPVTKKEVDVLRRVDSSRALKQLLERKFIEIAGRREEIGKPIVFKTTDRFLEVYGLRCIEDLPTMKELKAMNQEQ